MDHNPVLDVLVGLCGQLVMLLLLLLFHPGTLENDCLAGGCAHRGPTVFIRLPVEQLEQFLAILQDDVAAVRLGAP